MKITKNKIEKFDFERFHSIRRRSLGRLSWRLKRYLDRNMEPLMAARGYGDFKMGSLALLANLTEEGITNTELAKKAGISKQAMSKVVKELEENGYITTQPHESDARSSVIFLDERGKELFVDLNEVMNTVRARMNEVVGEERMEEVIDVLYELLEVLENDGSTV
ncbi:MarR family winged helix-turn-helix transcriptional regulator [Persicitalea jodogahamensis]|uniref:HTH marR-type domain-containing protein n=1 Tax=Persicitalea jodogahamensis TaxID=402147 RepID=A0A8J3GCL3_9BACT|nr:MarR family transcriptional regulator [Persicitalea jodogahamensis]GHB85472.1 hypothetical protein GCM10007390_46060 [Persicitalea jodogahamensis]